jgi:hypothetical protein
MVCGGVEVEPGTFSNAIHFEKFIGVLPHLHTITYPFREERHPTIALANRSALHRLCAWLWRKIENSCQAAFAKEFSIAGQQVMITACSCPRLAKNLFLPPTVRPAAYGQMTQADSYLTDLPQPDLEDSRLLELEALTDLLPAS